MIQYNDKNDTGTKETGKQRLNESRQTAQYGIYR